jgi:hypothetical protein
LNSYLIIFILEKYNEAREEGMPVIKSDVISLPSTSLNPMLVFLSLSI